MKNTKVIHQSAWLCFKMRNEYDLQSVVFTGKQLICKGSRT